MDAPGLSRIFSDMDIKIIVAAHKPYEMPNTDIYVPVQVGAKGKPDIGFVRDDTGENISAKNPFYCELTGLYWMWKNLDAEYLGLVHYRRHFMKNKTKNNQSDYFSNVLDRKELEQILEQVDIVLPKQRDYLIESIYSHYAHTHYEEHLIVTREILTETCPEYLEAYDTVLRGTRAHMFNMMVMKKELMMEYCSWVFDILEKLELRIDSSEYDAFQARYPGRVSEILLNVWVTYYGYEFMELPVAMHGKVKWMKKILSFLQAKFMGKRYKQGF